jgi:hypothetical protein
LVVHANARFTCWRDSAILIRRVAAKRHLLRFEDTMKVTRKLATAVTAVAILAGSANFAIAGEQYVFPSAGGVQLSSAPAPTFVVPGQAHAAPGIPASAIGGTFVYGQPALGRYEPPLPPPGYASGYAYGPQAAPYAGRLMSHALMVAPYANYAADYTRLFAPNRAVAAWTDRVFGFVDAGYTPVDGWTAAAYGLPRIPGPRRRSEAAPDLSLMPAFRTHPELQDELTFKRRTD